MRFRIADIAYAFALYAAGAAVFGPIGGVAAAGVIALFWLVIRPESGSLPLLVVAMGISGVVCATLYAPAIRRARDESRRGQCSNNLKQIGLGIANYEVAKGTFPAVQTRSASGVALHSWRLDLIPFMESSSWYHRFTKKDPWNAASNLRYSLIPLSVWRCWIDGEHDSPITSYFAVVDPRTAWPPDRAMKREDVGDPQDATLLLVEAPHRNVPWAKPEDVSFEEGVELLTTKPTPGRSAHELDEGFFYKPTPALNVLFVDGAIRALRLPLPRETAVSLLTANGGEVVDLESLDSLAPRQLDAAKCYAVAAFVALAYIPLLRTISRRPMPPAPS